MSVSGFVGVSYLADERGQCPRIPQLGLADTPPGALRVAARLQHVRAREVVRALRRRQRLVEAAVEDGAVLEDPAPLDEAAGLPVTHQLAADLL